MQVDTIGKVKGALQEAVDSYNRWADYKGENYDVEKAYGDIRGIFFNRLITELRQIPSFRTKVARFRRILIPEDLICTFIRGSFLTNLTVKCSGGYTDHERVDLLKTLALSSDIVRYHQNLYKVSPDSLDPITAIVEQVKAYKV